MAAAISCMRGLPGSCFRIHEIDAATNTTAAMPHSSARVNPDIGFSLWRLDSSSDPHCVECLEHALAHLFDGADPADLGVHGCAGLAALGPLAEVVDHGLRLGVIDL